MRLIYLFTILLLFSCKESNSQTTKEKITENKSHANNSDYTIWYYSPQIINRANENIKIYINKDSIKVMNGNTLMCKGEIVQEKMSFTDYFKSEKIGKEKQEMLKKTYNLNVNNDLLAVSNIYGDLAEEGCLFPFIDMFIVDNHLFYYDKRYYCYTTNEIKQPKKNNHLKDSSIKLPYNKKIDINNVKYNTISLDFSKGLENFSCDDKEIRYLSLPSKDKVNLILVPQDCGDFPYRFYLLTIKDNKVISNLYVEGEHFEPENNTTVEKTSFSIDENSILTVKTINKDFENGINEENKYKIDEDGKIVKI